MIMKYITLQDKQWINHSKDFDENFLGRLDIIYRCAWNIFTVEGHKGDNFTHIYNLTPF